MGVLTVSSRLAEAASVRLVCCGRRAGGAAAGSTDSGVRSCGGERMGRLSEWRYPKAAGGTPDSAREPSPVYPAGRLAPEQPPDCP